MIYCIYHGSCLDGFAAAWCVYRKYGPDAVMIPAKYGEDSYKKARAQLPEKLDKGTTVIVVDFSFPHADMLALFEEVQNTPYSSVVWLDHHKTAFEAFGWHPTFFYSETDAAWRATWPCVEAVLDNNRSGARIAWDYFFSHEQAPALIEAVDDTDRWVHKLTWSKLLTKAVWAYAPWDFNSFGSFATPQARDKLISEGALLQRKHDSDVAAAIQSGKMNCWIHTPGQVQYAPLPAEPTQAGYYMLGLAVNCAPSITSDVGHKLALESGTYGLCWCLGKDNVVKCSLRSNGEYDVSAIAKAFGGGGHRNAAGFSCDMHTLMSFLRP